MKKTLNFTNLREYYFQAVSNSSWANEGYIVALGIDEDDSFLAELKRLNNAFGIGVIKLNAENIIMSNLKSDRAGIIADVLIKHRVIKDVEELYEKNNYSV